MSKRARLEHRRQRQAELARARERARLRRRVLWASASIVAVLVVITTLVVVRLTVGHNPAPPAAEAAVSAELLAAVSGVPPAVLDQVGLGQVDALPTPLPGQPALTADGKPLVVYIGAEYCPYCAAQRWGLVVALSRFGTFANLGSTRSSGDDAFPNTATLSFHGATYTSQYLTFQGVETQSNVHQGTGYAPLETPTAQQAQLMQTYDAAPYVSADAAGSIPFIDIANKYLFSGASYSPALLQGKAAIEIANLLSDPSQESTQAIDGSANAFTAALCDVTGGQPGTVCASSAVTAYAAKLHAG